MFTGDWFPLDVLLRHQSVAAALEARPDCRRIATKSI